MSEVAVACCQLAPRIGELERNRAEATTAIVEAAGQGARIVVLPELAASGYVFDDAQEARACAEPLDGPTVADWTALAREHDLVETRHGRIGTMVCYDLEFPEWVRLAALAGADLLCAPTNWPREPRPATERPVEVVRVQAGASSNRIFIAATCELARARDKATSERNDVFTDRRPELYA